MFTEEVKTVKEVERASESRRAAADEDAFVTKVAYRHSASENFSIMMPDMST